MAFLDGHSGTDDLAIVLEGLVQVFVRPLVPEALDKDIAFGLHGAKQILVVGQRSTSLTVQLRKLDVLQELLGIQNVTKASEGVVEVPHLWSDIVNKT